MNTLLWTLFLFISLLNILPPHFFSLQYRSTVSLSIALQVSFCFYNSLYLNFLALFGFDIPKLCVFFTPLPFHFLNFSSVCKPVFSSFPNCSAPDCLSETPTTNQKRDQNERRRLPQKEGTSRGIRFAGNLPVLLRRRNDTRRMFLLSERLCLLHRVRETRCRDCDRKRGLKIPVLHEL